jgi:hypothetical protein
MTRHRKLFWAFVLVLLAGSALRFGYMRVHGLDPDETWTLGLFQGHLAALLSDFAGTVIEVDPKLYYILHYPWFALAGFSEVSARLPNIVADLLLGAVLMQTARARFGGRAGLVVGVLWCANPLLLWASGMVRMYSMLGLMATLAWLFLIRALSEGQVRWWIAFVAATLGAAYTHVLGFFVVTSVSLTIMLWAVCRRQWKTLLALAAIGIGYLPFLLSLWTERTNQRRLGSAPREALGFVLNYVSGLIANQPPLPTGLLWAVVILCLLLLCLAWKSRSRVEIVTLLLIFGTVSLGSGYLALRQTIFETMYIAYIAPIFLLGVAVGIDQVGKPALRALALVALSAAGLVGLYYQSAPNARDDFRSAARFAEVFGDQEDVVLVMSNYAESTFAYYYHGHAEVMAPWMRVVPDTSFDALQPLPEKHDTIWLVLRDTNVSDPDNRLDGWFRARYPVRTEAFPTGVTIRAYDLRPVTPTLPPEATPLDTVFEGRVALRGYQTYQQTVSARDERLHPPSGWVHITLYWEALEPGVMFEARPQVESAMSELYGATFTRGTEAFVMYPTPTWQPGQIWRTDYDINLNPATPPGEYQIVIRVFSPGDARPWMISEEVSWVILDRVKISR